MKTPAYTVNPIGDFLKGNFAPYIGKLFIINFRFNNKLNF